MSEPKPSPGAKDFVGVAEVAEILGLPKSNIYKIPGLPRPVAELRSGKVWRRSAIEKFAVKYAARSKPGPQRKATA